jgi:hypothetical protein
MHVRSNKGWGEWKKGQAFTMRQSSLVLKSTHVSDLKDALDEPIERLKADC